MLQDILPHQLNLDFQPLEPKARDLVFVLKDDKVLLVKRHEGYELPIYAEIEKHCAEAVEQLLFLFSVDERGFFLASCEVSETELLSYQGLDVFREMQPAWLAFAGVTAGHLAVWYSNNRYCGKCRSATEASHTERALSCPGCGRVIYPQISPAVIVGVLDGENILLTRYANRPYQKLALVAGFVEIGETPEDTVRREVREEVGLEVKNIRYYKSQPWAFSQSMLLGFFADLDGPPEIKLDTTELSEAVWLSRADIPEERSPLSLTQDMIQTWRMGKVT